MSKALSNNWAQSLSFPAECLQISKRKNSSHIGVHASPVIKVHENGGPALVELLLQD